jgi:TPR repeat protein
MLVPPVFPQDDPPLTTEDTSEISDVIAELMKRAEQGDASAQYGLGSMHYNGQGVPQDYLQAHMWYNLAASGLTGDDREAAVKNRDLLAKTMTSEQIAEAQRLAREWKPKTGSQ